MSTVDWPIELKDYLCYVTRELQFNWNLVAEQVIQYVAEREIMVDFLITAAECREEFSKGFDHEAFSSKLSSTVAERSKKSVQTDEIVPSDSSTNLYDGLSLNELIQHISEKEKHIEQRKEAIFRNVLNSLGTEQEPSLKPIHDVVTSTFKQSVREKAQKQELIERQAAEAEENKRLTIERKKLQERFLPDSEDQQGDDPLPILNFDQNLVREETTFSGCNFDSILGNDLDSILNDLEREYDMQAPGKSGEKLAVHGV